MSTRNRNYLLTINNPLNHGMDRDTLIEMCDSLQPEYFCMSDEVGGEENTPHTHIYISFENARSFESIRKHFKGFAHIDKCFGTPQENKNYVFKEDKWLDDTKGETNLRDTHFESGVLPVKQQGKRNDIVDIYSMVSEGFKTSEIIKIYPNYSLRANDIDSLVGRLKEEEFQNTKRDLTVIYISGPSRTGKTSYVLDKYGYENVYRISDYRNPFDGYRFQDVILFDEFRSDLPINAMLKYLEGYPCKLPSRYYDKQACYTKVYIVSNIPINDQYTNFEQCPDRETFEAFLNRINAVMEFDHREKSVYVGKRNFTPSTDINNPRKSLSLEEYEKICTSS